MVLVYGLTMLALVTPTPNRSRVFMAEKPIAVAEEATSIPIRPYSSQLQIMAGVAGVRVDEDQREWMRVKTASTTQTRGGIFEQDEAGRGGHISESDVLMFAFMLRIAVSPFNSSILSCRVGRCRW